MIQCYNYSIMFRFNHPPPSLPTPDQLRRAADLLDGSEPVAPSEIIAAYVGYMGSSDLPLFDTPDADWDGLLIDQPAALAKRADEMRADAAVQEQETRDTSRTDFSDSSL